MDVAIIEMNIDTVNRLMNKGIPAIRISAHTHYIRHAQGMIEAGASSVFSGEAEVALAMRSHKLRIFGATEEQIRRERQKNSKELFDRAAAEAAHAKTSKK